MSARGDLLREMTHQHLYMTDERANELIDAYAHVLAEEQRAYAREVGVPLEDGDTVAAGDVIDLIDPHASAGPVRPDEEPT